MKYTLYDLLKMMDGYGDESIEQRPKFKNLKTGEIVTFGYSPKQKCMRLVIVPKYTPYKCELINHSFESV